MARSRSHLVLLVAALILGAYWRVVEVPRALLFGDELHSLRLVSQGYGAILTSYQGTGAGMALPFLQRVLADLIGFNHWSIRLPALLGGLALLFGIYPLASRVIGRTAAVGAAALVATNSSLIFYSHFGRAYGLATFMAFAFVIVCQRSALGVPLSWRRAWFLALLLGLQPYLHLTTLGFALPVVLGLALSLGCVRERRRELFPLGVGLLAGGLLALLLHLPAWAALMEFTEAKTESEYGGGFGPLDVVAVLAGSRAGAWGLVLLGAAACIRYVHRERMRSLPLVLGCIGPAVALIVARPFGDGYAYARYALPALPCVFLLAARLFAGKEAPRSSAPRMLDRSTLLIPALIAVLLFSLAPRPWFASTDGAHANTYLRLYALPRFDEPFPRTPSFYSRLGQGARSVRLLEAPMLTTRARHLYRNYYLTHGQATSLAVFSWELRDLPSGPYVSLEDPDWREKANADYLILHKLVPKEVRQYWNFVYAEEPTEPTEAALMERHAEGGSRRLKSPTVELLRRLRKELGTPAFQDELVTVWKLNDELPDLESGPGDEADEPARRRPGRRNR